MMLNTMNTIVINESRAVKIPVVEHRVVAELAAGIMVVRLEGLLDVAVAVGLLVGVTLGTSSKQQSSPNKS
jgi:hypothetical protein